ncbi:VOC family protein [Pedobacter aquatilis]|uniref:VOC family protein n=1 Tax=Pedobacter aquatilis TaxID=351343 RepID=UPI002930B1CE|nr:VOC family protein [Pedobacter aquatilis]
MNTFHPYLNFDGQAEEAFNFYKSIFGGEFIFLKKIGDAPDSEQFSEEERNRVMHVALPINEHTILMASDCVPSAGHVLNSGNNIYINIAAESREEADRLFNGLSNGGTIEIPMEDQFWGDYLGSFKDKFGIQWMINFGSY